MEDLLMRSLLMLLTFLVASTVRADSPDPTTLKARAALALAFAVPKPPTYAEAYTLAIERGKPLLVFVGQPVREVPGCVCIERDAFPGAAKEAVVIGFPEGKRLRRLDLPGKPSVDEIRSVLASPPGLGTAVFPAGW
jgi:hypothetical protein